MIHRQILYQEIGTNGAGFIQHMLTALAHVLARPASGCPLLVRCRLGFPPAHGTRISQAGRRPELVDPAPLFATPVGRLAQPM